MSCIICSVVLSSDDLNKKIKCDQCRKNLCQDCSGLNATEVRVMQLSGKRTLRLVCCRCDEAKEDVLSHEEFECRVRDLEKSLEGCYRAGISSLRAEFSLAVNSLTEQVAMLKESNIQLVHLLNPSCEINSAVKILRVPQFDDVLIGAAEVGKLQPPCSSVVEEKLPGDQVQLQLNEAGAVEEKGDQDKDKNITAKNRDDRTEWTTVSYKRRKGVLANKRPAPTKGANNAPTNLRVAELTRLVLPKLDWIFVSGLHPDTREDEVMEFLTKNGLASGCRCFKMMTRKSKIKSSFKLGVPAESREDYMSSDLWPTGTLISPFQNLQCPTTRKVGS